MNGHPGLAAALGAVLLAKTVGWWGVQWDIRWHVLVGRDAFWIAPHVMTYAGVAAVAAVSFAVVALDTLAARRGRRRPGTIRVMGLAATPGWHLAWWGIAMTICAAPLDDLWHRLFGLDVTLWSPPHLLGIAGAQVNTLGCLLVACELAPAAGWRRRALVVAGGALLLLGFAIALDEAFQVAFRRGGLYFFTWPVLAAVAFAFTLALAARLAAWRRAPAAVAGAMLALHLAGLAIGDAGFALVRPEPLDPALLAAEPDSPIAIAHEMARRAGTEPARSMWSRAIVVPAALLMVALDGRRRPRRAAAGFGLALLALTSLLLARSPALAHALPSPGDLLPGLALALAAALAGGAGGLRLAGRLRPDSTRSLSNPAPA